MSKKSLNVILKNGFSNYKELSKIYISFRKKIKSLKKNNYLIAVSGGPDSLALTALSKAYSYENKCKFHYLFRMADNLEDSNKGTDLARAP